MPLSIEQLEKRRTGIGSSDVAAIAGLNPYRGPIDVWLDKTGRAPLETPMSPAMRFGHLMEPLIAAWYEGECGLDEKMEVGETTQAYGEPWMVATPDRLFRTGPGGVGDWKIVELKRVGSRMVWAWEGGPPDYVIAQVLWQMNVTGIRLADVCALVDDDFRIYPIAWMPEVASDLREVAWAFWTNHVQADVPPAIDASAGWKEFIARKWPRELLPIAEATPEAERLAAQLLQLKAEAKENEAEQELLQNQLKELIRDAAGMKGSNWRVTWKYVRGTPKYKELAERLGATAEMIETARGEGSRRFKIEGV